MLAILIYIDPFLADSFSKLVQLDIRESDYKLNRKFMKNEQKHPQQRGIESVSTARS
jgi:hypothetical protein